MIRFIVAICVVVLFSACHEEEIHQEYFPPPSKFAPQIPEDCLSSGGRVVNGVCDWGYILK